MKKIKKVWIGYVENLPIFNWVWEGDAASEELVLNAFVSQDEWCDGLKKIRITVEEVK